MAVLDSQVLVSVGGRITRLPPPDAGLAMSLGSWGNQSKLVNGSNSVVGSSLASRSYTLSWSALSGADLGLIQDTLAFAGDDTVLYRDLFHVGGNALSPLAGRPHLLADSLSPCAYDAVGTVLGVSSRISASPGRALAFSGRSPQDGQAHVYTENILVPAGYDTYARAYGTGEVGQVVVFRNGNLSGTVVRPATTTDVTVSLEVRAAPVTGAVHWVSVVLVPGGSPAPNMNVYRPPVGVGPLRVVPGTFNVTGASAVNDVFSCTVDLVEVWPWL